jgi:sodium/hydrogen antiporter
MHDADIVILALGFLILALALPSKLLARSPAPPELIALAVGIVVGPAVLGLIDIKAWGDRGSIFEVLSRLALGIGLVGVALRVPREFPWREWREIVVLIGLGMPLMWVASTAIIWFVIGVPFWVAALTGAMITPTDPIAASPIVTGELAERHLPERVRHAVSFESGANDGLSYLFVFLPLLLLTRPADEAINHWFVRTLLWEVVAASIVGLAIGWIAAKLLHVAEGRDVIHPDWRLVYTVAMALTAVGIGRAMGSDELLVAFAAGVAFVQLVSDDERAEEEHGQEAVNRFFAIPLFAVIGSLLPWAAWQELGWSALLLVAAVLLLRRPPVLLLLRPLMPNLHRWRDAVFVGWFGPIAIAALYYASLSEQHFEEPAVWTITTLVVFGSVVAHGVTASWGTRIYGRAEDRDAARAD